MKAKGYWSWWNQFGSVPLAQCVTRARELNQGVVVKANFWTAFNAFKNAGIPVAVERYTYPDQPLTEARYLVDGINRGAMFAVVNAEIEWERAGPEGGVAMSQLLDEIERLAPGTEVYASVDTRGSRMSMPYQRVMKDRCDGWMPMIYPKAFYPTGFAPTVHVPRAFADCLDRSQDFGGLPVLPTMQTYDNIGSQAVNLELAEIVRRELDGCQAYTVCHATNSEWRTFVNGIPDTVPIPPPPIDPPNELEEQMRLLETRINISGQFLQLAGYGFAGQEAPEDLLRTCHFIIHLAEAQN